MPRLLKSGLIIALVFGVVWLAVIIWWQETRALPTAMDIGVFLFALPLALLCLGWLGLRGARAAGAPRPEAGVPATAPETAPPTGAPPARLAVLGVAARTAAGDSAAATRAALAQQARPDLDPQLKDLRGFPVFAARVSTLDTAELRAQAQAAEAPAAALDDEPLRATALLRAVLEDARDRAVDHLLVTHMPDGPAEQEQAWPMLHVDLMLPGAWPAAARERAMAVAGAVLRGVAAPGAAWPPARLAVVSHEVVDDSTVPTHLHTLAARAGTANDDVPRAASAAAGDTSARTGARGHAIAASAPPSLRIVAAADSYISQGRAHAWQGQRRLMTTDQPQGLVPGEAAAALLLAAAPAPDQGQRIVMFAPSTRRTISADARGAAADAALPALAQALLQEHGVSADSLASLVSDADHRGSRPIETLQLATAVAPHLDPNQDCLAAGNRCGHVGAAAPLLALALAVDASEELDAPVLAALTQDPWLRGIAVVADFETYLPTHPSSSSQT
ncbi:hypothetical protein [Achromobacter aloeverae]|uniref:3-oxoacyl-ACP synthase n=1 Tax=Achromobacter aloeverae TaxID=1750518 RepID=A0A4Q1HGB2_9BURK|nr:hypothetical protein [Achromobacter aloeverae]RXN86215.1 hypothetical protein C7R54_21060 [Achromobacter aloeverae]